MGSPTTILTNILSWEGALVEGLWMIERGGYFYLFYSGNGYASTAYAIGVARATSPLRPFTKASAPILITKASAPILTTKASAPILITKASAPILTTKASAPILTTKASAPILSTKGDWAGLGHGSVLRGPSGDWVHVYHCWVAGSVGQSPGRLVLVDRIQWANGWPLMRGAPSSRSQPVP